jgi:outer membrane protein assembly factor BamB
MIKVTNLHKKRILLFAIGVLLLVSPSLSLMSLHTSALSASTLDRSRFNKPGNILITDQFNNRVIEIDPRSKQIVWSFGSGNGKLCNPGPGSIIGSNWAERLADGLTVMAGTGIPPGIPGTKACVDNRVIVVNEAGKIIWQYGQAGKTGNGTNLLNVPVSVIETPQHTFLITDQGNNRIIEVNKEKHIIWSYGPTSGPGALNSPNSAELLPNGHILIADEGNSRVIEITRSGHIVWEFDSGLNLAAFASRLPNGDTLITDSGNSRIIQVTHQKQIVFQFFTNSSKGSNANPLPTNAVRLKNGDTAIADQFNDRAIVINDNKQIVFQYGMTNHRGDDFDQLYGPYTAFVIGDYTGQTPPPKQF